MLGKVINRIIKAAIRKARESGLVSSMLDSSTCIKSHNVFGKFRDSYGNVFELYKYLRDELKPGWQTMLKPYNSCQLPSLSYAKKRINTARSLVRELEFFLKTVTFDFAKKKVLEIGSWDGAIAYAISELGIAEVIGSDISAYYIRQGLGVGISNASLSEQEKHLLALRKLLHNAASNKNKKIGCVKFVEDDICASSLPSDYFDLVCSWQLLEHVQRPKEALEQMHRILKPGGLAFHQYNPFFCLDGGHSLCTLDFPWGHARLDHKDFLRYLTEIRPQELEVAHRFYQYNLNRMTLSELEQYVNNTGFEILSLIKWSNMKHFRMLNEMILKQVSLAFPRIGAVDLVTPNVWLLLRKPDKRGC